MLPFSRSQLEVRLSSALAPLEFIHHQQQLHTSCGGRRVAGILHQHWLHTSCLRGRREAGLQLYLPQTCCHTRRGAAGRPSPGGGGGVLVLFCQKVFQRAPPTWLTLLFRRSKKVNLALFSSAKKRLQARQEKNRFIVSLACHSPKHVSQTK